MHVATLPWDINNSIFCRYSADMKENGQNFDKKFVLEEVHRKEVDRGISSEKQYKACC